MSFLGGAFLFALPLAAVPVIIHLLNRRRRQVVRWGAMHLLMESVPRKRRIWRLDDIILMALRALAVAAIVLALARPQVRSSLFTGKPPGRDVILIVDSSLSTGRIHNGGPVFDEIKQKALEVVERTGEGDRVRLMAAATIPHWEKFNVLANEAVPKDKLAERISDWKPTLATADMPACVQAALQAEVPEDATGRLIVIVTDGAEHGWNSGAGATWEAIRETAAHAEVPTAINIVTVDTPKAPLSNLSIEKLDMLRTRVAASEPFAVTAHIRNTGEVARAATTLKWDVAGESTGDAAVSALEPGQEVDVNFEATCDHLGAFQLTCSLGDVDDLPVDNASSLVVESLERLPVLICRSEQNQVAAEAQPDFLQFALGRRPKKEDGPKALGVFDPTVINIDALAGTDLSRYRCVILDDVLPVSDAAADSLDDYVQRGGGLWVIAGENVKAEQFNALMHRDGAGLSPVALGQQVEAAAGDADLFSIHPPEGTHPATVLLGNTDLLDIDDVRISRHWRLDSSNAVEEVSVLLETGDGEPLAVEHIQGDGRAIFLSMPCNTRWSNLPVCQAFVPLVQEWVWYLTQPTATHYNLDAGSPIAVSFFGADPPKEASITTPQGETVRVAVAANRSDSELRFRATDFPGSYQMQLKAAKGKDQQLPFYVRRDAAESQLAQLTDTQMTFLTQSGGLRFDADPLSLADAAVERIRYQPFWNYLLALVAVLFAAEFAFTFLLTRNRYAGAPQSVPVVASSARGYARSRRPSA